MEILCKHITEHINLEIWLWTTPKTFANLKDVWYAGKSVIRRLGFEWVANTQENLEYRRGSVLSMNIWYITVTSLWARWRLKSPASRLFTQPFVRAQIKENLKAPRHWPLCGGFTGDRWIPLTKGQQRGKRFHSMTSSCVSPSIPIPNT